MSVNDISGKAIASLGVKELNHILPVFHGDTIYAHTEVLNKINNKIFKKCARS
jgi:acyl dehydratase